MSFSQDPWGERLPRRVGLLGALAVVVGTTVGSGIFRVPATVAAILHSPAPVIFCWLIGGIVALFGALTLAELASALPRSGGIFVFLLEGFGPLPAFLFGWTELTVIRASALGATATIFAEYLGYFVPLSAYGVHAVAAGVIIVIGALNYFGVQRASIVMTAITIAKYAAIAGLGLLAFTSSTGSISHFTPLFDGRTSFSVVATALIPVMWTYDGWGDLSFMAGEIKSPNKTLPLALIFGTLAVLVVYFVVNIGFMYLMPLSDIAASSRIAVTAAEHMPIFGQTGAAIVAALVLLSTMSGLNGSMMTGPRIFFAMAEQGLFLRSVARVSPRFQTPSVAIALSTVLGAVYVLQNDFSQLADKFVLGIWPFYALSVIAVFVLRQTRPDLPRPYMVWGYPFVPAVFLFASFGMVANAFITDAKDTALTFAIIALGAPIYLIWTRFVRPPRT